MRSHTGLHSLGMHPEELKKPVETLRVRMLGDNIFLKTSVYLLVEARNYNKAALWPRQGMAWCALGWLGRGGEDCQRRGLHVEGRTNNL